jgi:imidazolonepropionase-like amidohydrolase
MQRTILRHKTIEHGTFMSEETMELMKSMMRIWSLLPVRSRKKNAEINGFYPKLWFPRLEVGPQLKLLAKHIQSENRFGTDAGVYPMASMLKNLAIW